MDIQKHPRESQETLPDSFLQNHNLVSSFTCRLWFNSNRQEFLLQVRVAWTCCRSWPLDSCMLQAIRKDCLNNKPFSISASFFFFFCHSSWNFFYFLLLLPTSLLAHVQWLFSILSLTIHSLLLHTGVLSIGDVFRIEIKNHDVLLPKTLREAFMVTGYNWLFKIIFLKDCCCK